MQLQAAMQAHSEVEKALMDKNQQIQLAKLELQEVRLSIYFVLANITHHFANGNTKREGDRGRGRRVRREGAG